MQARRFLEAIVGDGIHVYVASGRTVLAGPEDRASEAQSVLEEFPSLGGLIIRLIYPTDEEMRNWLAEQGEDVHAEHRARTARLERAGISDAEAVALTTTYRNSNSNLPERLKPKEVRS